MKFIGFKSLLLILASLAFVSFSAPAVSFPTVSVGLDVVKFAEEFIAVFATLIEQAVSAKALAALIPKLSLKFNLEVIKPLVEDMNNFNEVFSVSGIEDGNVRWVVEAENRTSEDPVIIYFHGGAYIIGLFPFFTYFCARIYELVGNDRLSILMLDYTLAQYDPYPTQLNQAALVYNEVQKSSNNIILAGDSAGGHLSLSVIRQGKFPVSGVTEVGTDSITGIMLNSPWVDLYTDDNTGSHSYNYGKDILAPKFLRQSTEIFLNYDSAEYNSSSLNFYKDTEADWASLVPNKTFINYGEHEILLTDIEAWIKLAGLSEDQYYESPNAIHDSVIFVTDDSDITPKIVSFFKDNF